MYRFISLEYGVIKPRGPPGTRLDSQPAYLSPKLEPIAVPRRLPLEENDRGADPAKDLPRRDMKCERTGVGGEVKHVCDELLIDTCLLSPYRAIGDEARARSDIQDR